MNANVGEVHMLAQTNCIFLSTDRQLDVNEPYQSFQVLFMQLYIIVSRTINPQWFHSARTALVNHLTVREVDNFVVGSMYNENHRCNSRHFVNATKLTTNEDTNLKMFQNSSKLTPNNLRKMFNQQ